MAPNNVLLAVFSWAVAGFVAVLFAQGVYHKLKAFTEFTGIVNQYRLLPKSLVQLVSTLVLLSEALVVVAVLLAPWLGFTAAQVGAVALLILYVGAVWINLLRGRRHIDCGCGGEPVPLSYGLVARNVVIVALVAASQSLVTIGWELAPLAAGFCIGLVLLYGCVNQVLANQGIYRRLWLGEQTA